MSGREWKPGDLALVTCSDGQERRAICGAFWLDDSSAWVFRDGTRRDAAQSIARPLVAIDPEDRAQVERFDDTYQRVLDSAPSFYGLADVMQAALREFANPTPPKPDEPQGLGAVVEDASQVEYVHLGSGLWAYGTTDGPSQGFTYDDIAVVRVLSEGVTND